MAVRALPLKVIVDDNLPVVTTHMAVVALRVKFRILDIVIDKADYVLQRF